MKISQQEMQEKKRQEIAASKQVKHTKYSLRHDFCIYDTPKPKLCLVFLPKMLLLLQAKEQLLNSTLDSINKHRQLQESLALARLINVVLLCQGHFTICHLHL